jgi:hypothetical protein
MRDINRGHIFKLFVAGGPTGAEKLVKFLGERVDPSTVVPAPWAQVTKKQNGYGLQERFPRLRQKRERQPGERAAEIFERLKVFREILYKFFFKEVFSHGIIVTHPRRPSRTPVGLCFLTASHCRDHWREDECDCRRHAHRKTRAAEPIA